MNKIKKYLKENPRLKILSDLMFGFAIAISAYALLSTYMIRRNLPAGVCPINSRTNLYYTSIGLLIVAFILSFFDRSKKKS